MRLISFVAISFLAITVSAWSPWTNPYQNEPPSQSTPDATQSPQHSGQNVGDRMKSIADKLEEPDIENDEKLELEKEYREAKMKWDDLTAEYNIHYRHYIQIRKGRDDAKIALDLLLENQKLIRDYNSKHDVKTGPSHNSCYNLVFLRDRLTISQRD
ncbi:hypothetical protein BASA50_009371 [Batrachochytrium salamandrivorans]|uniref:Secreted protein n=1 Tax=Batrachochytrium salamandrivorans TaxID=1357716 RepID=A0ABQ8F1G7_9FUNG|nr:hypothetical protein BASA50_009371 [Batrachochytrium salamandrivorans]